METLWQRTANPLARGSHLSDVGKRDPGKGRTTSALPGGRAKK